MKLDWNYYDCVDGRLRDEFGNDPFPNEPDRTAAEWIEWMEQNDIRGSVR